MSTLITDISRAVTSGATDSELNAVIAAFIGSTDSEDITTWRKEHYFELRGWAYPDPRVRFDADVKIANGATTEGQAQLDQYYSDCWAVKARFPKP